MEREIWKAGTFEYPLPAVMVSCGNMRDSNIVTVAWTGILNTKPPLVYISLRKSRYSYGIIKRTNEFVINLTTTSLVKATDWCGVKSGYKVDKFKEMNLHKDKAKFVKAPLISESPISIECKVKEVVNLGSHDMFIAEVLSIDVDKKYIDKNGKFNISKCNLIAYANGGYYALGKKIAKFGYSVKSRNKKRKKSQ